MKWSLKLEINVNYRKSKLRFLHTWDWEHEIHAHLISLLSILYLAMRSIRAEKLFPAQPVHFQGKHCVWHIVCSQ